MEITSMLSENTEVPMPFRAQEAPAARSSTTPKSSKRKGLSSAPKTDARSKRAVAASKHRLSEMEAYTLTLAAFFAQGELTWQKEGILGDLRQMLRISEEHHQREIQRIWANPSLCALARIQNGGRDNSDRGRSVYDILPDPKSPSDTESEVEDANSVVKKKKKKKKSASALPKPVAPSLQPSVGEPLLPPPPPPPVAASAFVAPSSTAERPSTKLVLKKAAKKAPDVKKDEAADGAPLASAVTAAAPAPAKPAGVDEMTKLQMERQKLQEELARLADEDEDEDDDGQDEASPAAGGGDDGSEEDA